METQRDIWAEVYMHSELCVMYGFMGFVISGYGDVEQYGHKWRFWKMDWILLL